LLGTSQSPQAILKEKSEFTQKFSDEFVLPGEFNVSAISQNASEQSGAEKKAELSAGDFKVTLRSKKSNN